MVWTCTREDCPGAGAPAGRMRSARRRQPQGRRAGRKGLSGRRLDRTALNSATPSLTAEQLSRKSSANDVFRKSDVGKCARDLGTPKHSVTMWVNAWVEIPPSTLDSRRRRSPIGLYGLARGKQRESGPAAVRRASAKRVETEIRSAGEPASGPVVVTRRALSGQAGLSGQRSCPRAWGLSPWVDTLVRVDAGHHRC